MMVGLPQSSGAQERYPVRVSKEMSGSLSRARTYKPVNVGSPKGREPYGDRVPVVVRGRESRPQGEGAQVTGHNNQEVCEMQNAETVLGVLRDRGRKGLPCNELYRQMFSKELYLMAYGRIYANHGAMTPGASSETADGMSEENGPDPVGENPRQPVSPADP
jgi:hypothetical protein